MMKKILMAILISQSVFCQSEYPQDYFTPPLDIPLVLSGTFGELRATHFHAGLDFKTKQREGLKVYTAAKGYVSRIKISHYGYGKALYITHPNGYTSVYGHLKSFAPKLEAYIKKLQYDKETYEIEVFPNVDELTVNTKELIAYSGNTGGSGGPHLHFEIRDNQERPINPMLFGIEIKDSRPPNIFGIFAYPKTPESTINGKNERVKLRLIPKSNGMYDVESVKAIGEIGFGIVSYDKQDLAANRNGLSKIETSFNGGKSMEVDFSRFSFYEGKFIKRYIDYEYYKKKKSRIQKLFIEPHNELSLFKDVENNGYLKIEDSTASVYKIKVSDFKKNKAQVNIPIIGKAQKNTSKPTVYNAHQQIIFENSTTTLNSDFATVTFNPHTVYEDVSIDFKSKGDTLFIHKDIIPLRKNFYINYDISKYKSDDKNRLYIARLYGYKNTPNYVTTKRKDQILTASTNTFGKFALALDAEPPKITPLNFQNKKWLSKYRYLKLKIEDKASGISKYRATINGTWILMEYDYKTKTLTYDFNNNDVTTIKNNFKLVVTDNVGNNTTFEATFYRK